MIALRRVVVTTLPFCRCKLVKSASNPEIFVFFSEREAEGLKIRGKWPWIFDSGKIQRKHATYPEAYDSHFNVRFPKCNITIGIWLPFLDSKPLVLIIKAYTFVFLVQYIWKSEVFMVRSWILDRGKDSERHWLRIYKQWTSDNDSGMPLFAQCVFSTCDIQFIGPCFIHANESIYEYDYAPSSIFQPVNTEEERRKYKEMQLLSPQMTSGL